MSTEPTIRDHLPAPLLRMLRLAADTLTRYPFPVWHYGDSIGFEGLLSASELLGDPQYAHWVHGALKSWAARRLPFRETDNTAPSHVLCEIIERTGDEHLLTAAVELADYLLSRRLVRGVFVSFEEAPLRAPYGGFSLSADEVLLLAEPGAGVFVDCMHFDLPFFAHLGRLTRDASLQGTAVEQALAYIELLQDESGLFWHFWLEKADKRYGYAWGRGQGWALLGMLDLLRQIPKDHYGYAQIAASCHRLCQALAARQNLDGGWSSVVVHPSAGPEASTAAFAAVGFPRAFELGVADGPIVDASRRAWRRTVECVDERGVLTNVSAALWASTQPLHYLYVPTGFVVPWGQGPLLLAANEMARLLLPGHSQNER